MRRGVALLLVALVPGLALAKGSPIRSAKALEGKLKRASKKVVKEHLALIKRLQKEHGEAAEWYVWVEARCVERLDPGHRKVKDLLVEPPPPAKALADYRAGRGEIDALAHEQLGELMERCDAGGLSQAESAPLARLVLAYAPNHSLARRALGFHGAPGRWLTPREEGIQKAYADAWTKVPSAKGRETVPWPQLEKDLGLKLTVREGLHCYAAAVTGSARVGELNTVVQSADLAYAALHHDLLGENNDLFASPEKRGTVTGFKPGRFHAPLFLLLDNNQQHQAYLANVVSEPSLKAGGKKIGFVTTVWRRQLVISDSWQPRKHLKEWPAGRMTHFVLNMRFGQHRPTYLMQGLARYYSGHVSGQASVRLVSVGSQQRGGEKYKYGTYGQIRDLARNTHDTFKLALPLTRGFNKTVESVTRRDNAIASAFVDFLLATDRGKLFELLRVANTKELRPAQAIAKVFDDPAATDAAFAEWLLKNY